MNYLPYRRTKHGITILYTLINVNLAQCKIGHAKCCHFWPYIIVCVNRIFTNIIARVIHVFININAGKRANLSILLNVWFVYLSVFLHVCTRILNASVFRVSTYITASATQVFINITASVREWICQYHCTCPYLVTNLITRLIHAFTNIIARVTGVFIYIIGRVRAYLSIELNVCACNYICDSCILFINIIAHASRLFIKPIHR